jgi:signal peptidase I
LPTTACRWWAARIPGFQDVERDQPFVFNYPADDIYYNDLYNAQSLDTLGAITIPAMKENYVKRCVAVAGDLFEVRNGDVYIDNVRQPLPVDAVVRYRVVFKATPNGQPFPFNTNSIPEFNFRGSNEQGREQEVVVFDTLGRAMEEMAGLYRARISPLDSLKRTHYRIYATQEIAQQLAAFQNVDTVYRDPMPRGYIYPGPQWQPHAVPDAGAISHFPYDTARFPFNNDQWGPIRIPKAGETVTLTAENIDWYERIIGVHEGHELVVQRAPFRVTIDGQPATTYTFELDYFFAMGDNRYSSADSRFWGFVPEDHVVGKPVLVLFSKEGSDWRWERLFNAVD